MISETALRLYAAKREGVLKTNAQFWREFSHVEAVNALPVDPEKYERELQDADLQLTCAFDADFPPLPSCKPSERPYLFAYRGDLSLLYERAKNIAVVGTLAPTEAVLRREKAAVKALVERGFTIVSGLARGCDAAAHEACFACGGKTVAVLPTPLSNIYPKENDALAERIGLPNAKKKDSTGICFIGERPFREFLNRYLPTHPGPIKTPDGKVVGEHMGLSFYTLGQRKGIGVGGLKDATGEPWFVARKDLATNTLWICQGHDHPWLLADRLRAAEPSWVAGHAPDPEAKLTVKTRYRQKDTPCRLADVSEENFTLLFDDEPQWAATPGQSAVLYQGDVCLGGGFIDTSHTIG